VSLNLRIPSRTFDELCHRAYVERRGVSALVRGVLRSWLRRRPDEI
jgi:hypothetical protein